MVLSLQRQRPKERKSLHQRKLKKEEKFKKINLYKILINLSGEKILQKFVW